MSAPKVLLDLPDDIGEERLGRTDPGKGSASTSSQEGVDSDLVVNADGEVFEMNNGCVCSAVRGDLIRTLGPLAKALLALMLCFAAVSLPARAHPHAWIDLRSTVVLDAAGRVTAIEQQWLFDQFYTVFVTDELSGAAGTRASAVSASARVPAAPDSSSVTKTV